MKNVKYTVKWTTKFKKDYKLALKRNLDIKKLQNIVEKLANGIYICYNNHTFPLYHCHYII